MLPALAIAAAVVGQHAINMDQSTATFRAARNSGAGCALVLGDSLTYKQGAIWENLVEISTSEYGSGGPGYQPLSMWTGASWPAGQWHYGSVNDDTPPHWSLDGMWISTASASQPSSVLCEPWSPTTVLHYATGPATGAFTVTSGSSSWTVPGGGAQGVGALPLSLTQNSLTINTAGNGHVTLLGFVNSASTNGPVYHRAANGGWGLDEVLRRNWSWDAQVSLLNPDLVIVCFGGQNDWAFSHDTALWEQYLRAVCDRIAAAAPTAGIVLVSNYASSDHPDVVTRWETLSAVQRALAEERGYGFIDLFRAGGAYSYWVSSGFIDGDGLHFTAAGGRHAAEIIHCAIDSLGTCLNSAPCAPVDFNQDGLFPDITDIDDFVNVFSGGPCSTPSCGSIDFNRDGLLPDIADIDALLRVFAGGPCN